MAEKFKNLVSATLASDLAAAGTTMALKSGDGAQLPSIPNGTANTFRIMLTNKSGSTEIISICRREAGSDTLYVGTGTAHQAAGNIAGRAMEGTTALAITAADDHVIEMPITAAQIEEAIKYTTLGDVTATPAEINIACDGIEATVAEVNALHDSGVIAADVVKLHAITASASQINAECNVTAKPLKGDSTAGRIVRSSLVQIWYASGGNSNVQVHDHWNGDPLAATTMADSSIYYDLATAGNAIAVLSVGLYQVNLDSTVSGVFSVMPSISSNNVRLSFYVDGASAALSGLVSESNTGFYMHVTYLTSA